MKTPCSLEDINQHFGGTSSLHFQTLKIDTGDSFKTLVSVRMHGVTLYKRKMFIPYRKQYWTWNAILTLLILSFCGDSMVMLTLLLMIALYGSTFFCQCVGV
jgi:hypothetical protein